MIGMTVAEKESKPTLVLVHGAWHGRWAWDPLLPFLRQAGIPVLAVQLPGIGRGPGEHDLAGHAAFLRAELQATTGPVVVCGHSYGGAVVTEAAAGLDNVKGLVYVAAFMVDVGESCVDANVPAPVLPDPTLGTVREGDYLRVPAAAATQMFYGDCTPQQARTAIAGLTPEHVKTVSTPVTRAAWREIPSTYVVCENDNAILAHVQTRMARRAKRSLVMDSAHSPMLSRPRELATLLTQAVG
ncbi:alpha/beta fold hydrolase [Streptosporangium sp. CA-135522]|uniref:alpha/beta fold hydrolase n=1 Tax=Streptosporangium sp. CA-135522 TaxID=3240072 RepID=UPI003D8AE886